MAPPSPPSGSSPAYLSTSIVFIKCYKDRRQIYVLQASFTCHVGPTRGASAHVCFARQARASAVLPRSIVLKGPGTMIVRHLHKVHKLLAVLDQPAAEVTTVRTVLTLGGHFPSRRTWWEPRMSAIPDSLPAQICCLCRLPVQRIQPKPRLGPTLAICRTVLPTWCR